MELFEDFNTKYSEFKKILEQKESEITSLNEQLEIANKEIEDLQKSKKEFEDQSLDQLGEKTTKLIEEFNEKEQELQQKEIEINNKFEEMNDTQLKERFGEEIEKINKTLIKSFQVQLSAALEDQQNKLKKEFSSFYKDKYKEKKQEIFQVVDVQKLIGDVEVIKGSSMAVAEVEGAISRLIALFLPVQVILLIHCVYVNQIILNDFFKIVKQ